MRPGPEIKGSKVERGKGHSARAKGLLLAQKRYKRICLTQLCCKPTKKTILKYRKARRKLPAGRTRWSVSLYEWLAL